MSNYDILAFLSYRNEYVSQVFMITFHINQFILKNRPSTVPIEMIGFVLNKQPSLQKNTVLFFT